MRRDENKIRSGTVKVNNQKQICKATQNEKLQENMRGQRGTMRALARICRCH